MKKILILDFDGTVIDSNYIKEKAILEFIKRKYKVNILEKLDYFQLQKMTRYQLIGLATKSSIRINEKKEIDLEIKDRVLESKIDPNLINIYFFCLKSKIKIYLVSNTPNDALFEIVNSLKISHYFHKIIGKKPGLEKSCIFKKIICDENVKPNDILSVGDNINDYIASKENKIPFHGIGNNTLNCLKNTIPISDTLIGIIKSLK